MDLTKLIQTNPKSKHLFQITLQFGHWHLFEIKNICISIKRKIIFVETRMINQVLVIIST